MCYVVCRPYMDYESDIVSHLSRCCVNRESNVTCLSKHLLFRQGALLVESQM